MGELELIRGVAARTRSAVVTGPAAAKVRGLQTLDRVERVDLLLPGAARASAACRGPQPAVYRSGYLAPEHVVEHEGLRVTSTIQMAFDTSRYHGPHAALVVLESARFRRPEVGEADLLELANTLPRAKGTKMFRKVIEHSAATSQTALETVGRHALIEARIPGLHSIRGQVGFEYYDLGRTLRRGRMDLLVNGFICVELDGRGKYTSDEVTFEERMREKFLLNQGYLVLRAGWADVWGGALEARVASAIRRMRFLGNDPFAGNVPAPLNDGEIQRRRPFYAGH
ncbi:hypothetical protein SAMN04488535_0989 [Corynebacterium mycetoides]|uniref:DUF559 domain-containing protein n=1 Tax=Corynebacterium mycetoides TaxID=38302 RepID=A0A1G9NEQ3_9CORY|nr:hypothetical protein [Corynebacterium mycetoides]SDL84950.1 hypothetical protein SAMN04488535_0989 [Corynebacterium mycetoides]